MPAFAGLGAPHWDPYARGVIAGITRGTVRLVAHPSIERIADLKGKVLGVDAVSTGYSLALRKILQDRYEDDSEARSGRHDGVELT